MTFKPSCVSWAKYSFSITSPLQEPTVFCFLSFGGGRGGTIYPPAQHQLSFQGIKAPWESSSVWGGCATDRRISLYADQTVESFLQSETHGHWGYFRRAFEPALMLFLFTLWTWQLACQVSSFNCTMTCKRKPSLFTGRPSTYLISIN